MRIAGHSVLITGGGGGIGAAAAHGFAEHGLVVHIADRDLSLAEEAAASVRSNSPSGWGLTKRSRCTPRARSRRTASRWPWPSSTKVTGRSRSSASRAASTTFSSPCLAPMFPACSTTVCPAGHAR